MISRRELLALLGWSAIGVGSDALAQSGRVARIGLLANARTWLDSATSPLTIKLQELGWSEARNLKIERRYVSSPADLRRSARELAALKLDLVLTAGFPATRAAKQEIADTPIVFFVGGDLSRSGLVANLAHPEGNLTGVAGFAGDLGSKRIALLKEAAPAIVRLAVLGNPSNAMLAAAFADVRKRARSSGIEARLYEAASPAALEPAFASMSRERMQGLTEFPDPMLISESKRIVELAVQHELLAIFDSRQYAEDGALMSYGPDYDELSRRVAVCMDRILRGAKPGEVPVELPRKFETVINLKTARTLGLTIPQSVLLRADRVIE